MPINNTIQYEYFILSKIAMRRYWSGHFTCFVSLLSTVILQTSAIFSRYDWRQAPIITAFTTCGLDIGPVYANMDDYSVNSPTHLTLWAYYSLEFVGYRITELACHKYGDMNQDTEIAAIFSKKTDSSLTHVGLFKITEGSRALVNMNFNYTYNNTQVQATSISLERSMLCIQYRSTVNRSSLISIYSVGKKPAIFYLEFTNVNISSLLDNEANLGVYDPSYPKFTLYYGDRYQHSYSVKFSSYSLCGYDTYQFTRMKYERVQYPRDDDGNYDGDQNAPFYIESRFYLVFRDTKYFSQDACNIVIDVFRFPKQPTRKQASQPYNMDNKASYLCDGRNFYPIQYQYGIDESSDPTFYYDIKLDQPVTQVLCSRRRSIFFWMSDYTVFYILSQNRSDPIPYNHTFIDVYEETYFWMWMISSLVSCCCCLCFTACTCQHGICKVLGAFCLNLSSGQLQQIQEQLEM